MTRLALQTLGEISVHRWGLLPQPSRVQASRPMHALLRTALPNHDGSTFAVFIR